MDALLKLTADAGHAVTVAEEAAAEERFEAAREALDQARDLLADLRERWPEMSASEQAVIGSAAAVVRERLDGAAAAVPARATLSQGAPVSDPDEERDPAAEPG